MAKDGSDIIYIMRNVTGRTDASDPQFSDAVMLQYANDFLNLEMPQEVRLYQNWTWWEFDIDPTTVDPLPVDLQALGYTTLGPTAYILATDSFTPAEPNLAGFVLFWYQSPSVFYSIWPDTQNYQPQRPQDVLYYNNALVFRGPPDKQYHVKIMAYKVEPILNGVGDVIRSDYFWRYVAYGASLDIFSDYGEMDKYNVTYPAFMRYKSMVYGRTNLQLSTQRTYPTF
jgi:hypothetical protein